MNNLESGLFLPIRFYDDLNQQDRFKNQSKDVKLIEINYPFVDCVSLAPFQVIRPFEYNTDSVVLTIICLSTGEETELPFHSGKWEEHIIGDYIYLSYLGNDDFSGLLEKGIYYLRLDITDTQPVTYSKYSDLFSIANCANPDDLNEYRRWNDSNGLRKINSADDLRIVKIN